MLAYQNALLVQWVNTKIVLLGSRYSKIEHRLGVTLVCVLTAIIYQMCRKTQHEIYEQVPSEMQDKSTSYDTISPNTFTVGSVEHSSDQLD